MMVWTGSAYNVVDVLGEKIDKELTPSINIITAKVKGLHTYAKQELAPTLPKMASGIDKLVAYAEKEKAQLEDRLDRQAKYIEKLEGQLRQAGLMPAPRTNGKDGASR